MWKEILLASVPLGGSNLRNILGRQTDGTTDKLAEVPRDNLNQAMSDLNSSGISSSSEEMAYPKGQIAR